jgi:hypothetical protein
MAKKRLCHRAGDNPQFRSTCVVSALVLYGLVLFSAVAHATWNSLVKSAGDRVLTITSIRFTGLVLGLSALPFVNWPQRESWKWLGATASVQFGYYALLVRSYWLSFPR